MIKRLRKRFILSAILSVFVVLFLIIGGINLFNYLEVVKDSDNVLNILMDNGGVFPEHMMHDPFERRMPGGGGRINSPEIAFESRYFSVRTDQSGNILATTTDRISAVDKATAEEYAGKANSSGRERGFIGDYRYYSRQDPADQTSLIIFYDCGRSLGNFRSFLLISVIISAGAMVLVSLIIIFVANNAIKPVAESYEKQKRFITDAGHEIKTPLAIINADADVLSMDIGEDNEWVADIRKQTKRLTELTNDLILLSKMEEGSSTLTMTDVDLSSVLGEQAESYKARAVTRGVEYQSSIDGNVHIKADRKAVEGLINILLDNAVKYCPEGGLISVGLTRSSKGAVMTVTNDTKEDMSEEDMRHLFDRFYRTDRSRNSETGGHGIGLSIAGAITEAHGGRITATKKAAKKITFTAILPASA